MVWLGAMKAWGGGEGVGHTPFELRLGIPNKDTTTIFGVRYLRFDKDDAMLPTGDAILFTFGGGIAALN